MSDTDEKPGIGTHDYLRYLQRRLHRTILISESFSMEELRAYARGQIGVLTQVVMDLEAFQRTGSFPRHREMEEE